MGSSSVSAHIELVHYQGLLLVVSLLNFWIHPTTAQVTVHSKNALEGTDVHLYIHHTAPKAAGFLWYKGETIDSHHYIASLSLNPRIHKSGPPDERVIVEEDGSLLFKNVTMKDSGIYTILVQLQGCQKMIACGRLTVYPFVSGPTLLASNTTVTENKDAVVLTCDTNAHAIQWLFKGTSLTLTERITLSRDHRNLTIYPVLREDAGNYQCKGFNPINSAKSASLALDVKFE
ncbi:carcinoembryonic antigen-related cell adhesion molecule 21-like [Phyllostomus discolor]|uniref:Carcinoembryonic antigen-related cell adhesion molecule 21-like n=1 Tax=Phyllostomus discolor TaxID=89673 RepID=A0A6J2N6S2_9CHIR|nr:carcinoembryonic antigen-related cell adhesion molecule 21-like [Phyllostomus discolor]